MSKQRIDRCVELICELGCQTVREVIVAMERGEEMPQLAGLDSAEKLAVLEELKKVMDVYDGPCRI
jgi:hypothetical protein